MSSGGIQHIWQRHDLLRIRPDAWAAIYAALPEHVTSDILSRWAKNGYPLIIRRYFPEEISDSIPAGVPMPPHLGKQRIAVLFTAEEVAGRVAPVSLRTARDVAPLTWANTISALLDLGERYGGGPHVTGSLLWQRLTNLPYLTEVSDLDLVWSSSAVCRRFLEELAEIDRHSPMRLDGELVLTDGGAVNWRELHACLAGGGERTVLIKSMMGIQVKPAATILRCGQPL